LAVRTEPLITIRDPKLAAFLTSATTLNDIRQSDGYSVLVVEEPNGPRNTNFRPQRLWPLFKGVWSNDDPEL
jgi:hypothetical protein